MRKEIIFVLILLAAKSLCDSESFESVEQSVETAKKSTEKSSTKICSSEDDDSSCSESCSEEDSSCDDSDDDSCSKKTCTCECVSTTTRSTARPTLRPTTTRPSTTQNPQTTSRSTSSLASTTLQETSTTLSRETTTTKPNVCEGQLDGYVPYENNCTLFYYCENGKADRRFCIEGEIFNPDTGECEPGDAESCVLFTTTQSTSTSVSTTESTSTSVSKTESSTVPETTVSRTQSSTEQPEFPRFYCECPVSVTTNHILIPSPYSCEHYYECIWGVAYRRNCPEGLFFDAPTDTCVNQEDAHCGQAIDCIAN